MRSRSYVWGSGMKIVNNKVGTTELPKAKVFKTNTTRIVGEFKKKEAQE